MSDLHSTITAYLDHQEACGWHQDWPEALAALRAVMKRHKPVDRGAGPHCAGCDTHATFTYWPCQTVLDLIEAFGPEEIDRFKGGAE